MRAPIVSRYYAIKERATHSAVRSPSELGSEQSEPLHWSAHCHMPLLIIIHLSFSFLLISHPLTALCLTTSTLQSCNTRRKRPMHTNHSPSHSLPSYFLFLSTSHTVLLNNAYQYNVAIMWHPYALSSLSF
jgi:hypothetical protein